jgi:hypothetical protein
MNESDRKAFEKWISGPPYERSVDRYPNDPARYGFPGSYRDHDVDLCKFAWLAARDHYRKRVAELVEAVEQIDDDNLGYLDDARQIAAKLKEQP